MMHLSSLFQRHVKRGLACAALVLAALNVTAAPPQVDLRAVVGHLASPELGGRLTGSAGEHLAAEYLTDYLRKVGVKSLPGRKDYLLPFEFAAAAEIEGSQFTLIKDGNVLTLNRDADKVRALGLSKSGSASGAVVFAGYGIDAVRENGERYDSFAGLELKGKIALVLHGLPATTDSTKNFSPASRADELRTKAQNVRNRGGVGLLVVAPPAGGETGLIAAGVDTVPADSDLVAATIDAELLSELLTAGGHTLEELKSLQAKLDRGEPVAGFELAGLGVAIDAKLNRSKKLAHNIVGYLPATAEHALPDEYIVLGAHYDHLGDGTRTGNSSARPDEVGKPHLGADDNASGTAAVLAAAERLAGQKLRRPVIVAFWTGEEIGTLGSQEFAKRGPIPAEKLVAYINLDMVGRVRENKLTVLGLGSSEALTRIADSANTATRFTLGTVKDPYNPSDTVPFYLQHVPVLYLFSGSHGDYHRPSDTADKINYPDLERVVQYTRRIVEEVAALPTRPDYQQVKATHALSGGGSRAKLRVSLGAVPGYASDESGLKLEGVVADSPAARAGLKEGDLIVKIGEQRITNIYDYTTVLGQLKPDQPVALTYVREGKEQQTQVTPVARAATH